MCNFRIVFRVFECVVLCILRLFSLMFRNAPINENNIGDTVEIGWAGGYPIIRGSTCDVALFFVWKRPIIYLAWHGVDYLYC